MQAFTPSIALLARSPFLPRPSACNRRPTSFVTTASQYLRANNVTSNARASLSPSDAEAPKAASAEMVAQGIAPVAKEIDEHGLDPSIVNDEHIVTVRTQMEFWFSASNLRRDWYLRRQMDEEGWLDPSVFLHFNRVKQLNATLDDIIIACRTSEMLQVRQPATDGSSFGDAAGQTRIRRSPDLPNFRDRDVDEFRRSFILSNLPADWNVENIQQLFSSLAPLAYVRVYRQKDSPDSPRALICFEDLETAERIFEEFHSNPPDGSEGISMNRRKVPSAEPAVTEGKTKNIVCEIVGIESVMVWKVLYKALSDIFVEGTGKGMRYMLYNTGNPNCFITVPDNEITRSFIFSLSEKGVTIGSTNLLVRILDNEEELKAYWNAANEQQVNRTAKRTMVNSVTGEVSKIMEGIIVKLDGLAEDVTWQKIKSAVQPHASIVFLHYERKAPTCYIRFRTTEEALCVRDALSDPDVEICGQAVTASILEGEEELEYWERANQMQRERRNSREGKENRE